MDDARTYLCSTEPATKGLFKLLTDYGWHKMRAFVEITKVKTREELEQHKTDYDSVNVAREVIAGSILQIAYIAIKRYGVFEGKSENTQYFEEQMNRLIRENPSARTNKYFSLPDEFCIGRDIGHLPLGMVVYAARNQYNHFDEDRLSVVNEVVFNHLYNMWPNPANGLSFNLGDKNYFYSYSVLAALGWTDNDGGMAYDHYKKDIMGILRVES